MEPRSGLVITRVGVGLLLLAAVAAILAPFVAPMAWAGVVAFMSFGLYDRLRRISGRPRLAASLLTGVTLLLIGIPVVSLLLNVVEQSVNLVGAIQGWVGEGVPLPSWLAESRLGVRAEALRAELLRGLPELRPKLLELGKTLSESAFSVAGGVASNLFDFAITVISLFVFYVEGERMVAYGRRVLVWLFPGRPPEFVDHIGQVVRAVVVGVIGTAIVQGVLAGIGFLIFGVPYAVALGGLTTLLSFLPGGATLVWGGATAWLFATGSTGSAIGMGLWGLLLVGSIDNVLRPILIRRSGSVDVPFLLILFGVLGGLSTFGLLGLLIGPVVLSIAFTLLAEIPPREPLAPAPSASS